MSSAARSVAATLMRSVFSGLTAMLAGCSIDSHFLYHPQPYRAGDEAAIAARFPAAEAFVLQRPDGVRLHGWLTGHRQMPDQQRGADAMDTNHAPGSNATPRRPLTIYFGGNAEETSWLLGEAQRFAGHMLLFINYRGYGGSSGTPHENVLLDDALAVYDAVLMLAGARDTLILPQHSEQLRALWGGPARLVMLPEADHNSMQDGADYWREIAAFLGAR